PLDCPICDQGGECDLQDQAVGYGFDRSRFHENKRAVADKELGPLIKTVMTRCINCTRCVRFAEEIAGTPVLGQMYRGEDAEIGTFIDQIVDTELSGNLIDVCPVGALTSKPYAFKARSWELVKTETIDVHDAVGSNIRVDARGREVMRILPRLHEDVNEEWIGDRSRFSYDGLAKGRLDRPWIRDEKSGKLRAASWDEAFGYIADKLKGVKGEEMAALVGDLADCESITALKDLMNELGCNNLDCRTDGSYFDTETSAGYLFNSGIAGIDEADAILLVGTDPRHEATMVNARIRRAWLERRVKIYLIGEPVDLTYPYEHDGTGPKDIEKFMKEKSAFSEASKPMIIAGTSAFQREDGPVIQSLLFDAAEKLGVVKEGWNGFNILHSAASRVGALEIGFTPSKGGKNFSEIIAGSKDGSIKALYLLGADEFNTRINIGWKTFVIYQGHHGDHGAQRADVILPGAAYTEKDALYVNTEGRVQIARAAVSPPGEAKEDWKILRALSDKLGKTLPYNTLADLHAHMQKSYSIFKKIDDLPQIKWARFGTKGKVSKDPFVIQPGNYYLSNAICRASTTMNECAETFTRQNEFHEAAE
ncbi:MAG: NADH-quinone oxidoreductase subunit G, partial [Alphaproteobacteria bacterium]|nr:NADH-quinone oxidoreductase subunit G [Alphaproteobacteria bacterium]